MKVVPVSILHRGPDGVIARRVILPTGEMRHGPGDDGDEAFWRIVAFDEAGDLREFALIDVFGWDEEGGVDEVDGSGAYPPWVVLVPKESRAPDAVPAGGAGDRVAAEGRMVRRADSRAERIRLAARRRAGG